MTTAITSSGVNASPVLKDESLSGDALSGLMLIILAFTSNYEAIQGYNTKQMGLSAALAEQQQKEAAKQILIMEKTLSDLNWIAGQHWTWTDVYNATVSKLTSDLNVQNSKFNQMNTLYNGMVQGVNQNASDTTQTLQTDLQMIGTNGVLATLQTIAQCV